MNFDWYPWDIQAYRKNTMHLGLAEDGAYRRLIDEYMMTRAPLPDNDAALARIIGVSVEQWAAVAPSVRPFFEPSNSKLIHKRCEEELHAQACQAHATSTKNRAAANSRWAKQRELKEIHARALQAHAPRMPNDATRQDKERIEAGRDAPLARSPGGELRGASGQTQVSSSLKRIVAAKGWGQ